MQAPLVLIVDATASTREFCELILSTASYRVATASDCGIALKMAAALAPDVVLLDLVTPGDGLSLLERIPRELAPKRVAMLAMCSFGALEHEALARGASAFLHKPLESADLLIAIDAAAAGRPLTPLVLRQTREKLTERREAAVSARAELLARIDLQDADLNGRLRVIVRWLAGYFGVGLALVSIQTNGKFKFQAAFGGEPGFIDGGEIDARLMLCEHVVDAGAPLLLNDVHGNPVFGLHPRAEAGCRFYAGVPLRGSGDVVLGTLCVMDRSTHRFHGEDLAILEAIADGIGRRLTALAHPKEGRLGSLVGPVAFDREVLLPLITAELRRVQHEGGGAELAMIDVGSMNALELRARVERAYEAAKWSGLAVVDFAPGVLAILAGGSSCDSTHERMIVALGTVRGEGALATGVVTVGVVGEPSPPVDAKTCEHLADDLRVRSRHAGGAIQRLVLSVSAGPATKAA